MEIRNIRIGFIFLFVLGFISVLEANVEVDSTIYRLIRESQLKSTENLNLASYKAKRAIRVAQRKGKTKLLADAYCNYGEVLKKKYFFQEALQAFLKAESIYVRHQNKEELQILRVLLAKLFVDTENYKEALILYHNLRNKAKLSGDQKNYAEFSVKIALCQFKLGLYQESELELKKCKHLFQRLNDLQSEREILLLEARMLQKQGESTEAIQLLKSALNENMDDAYRNALVYVLLGDMYMQKGERTKALGYFEKAREIFRTEQKLVDEANTLVQLSELYKEGESAEEYKKYLTRAGMIFSDLNLQYSKAYADIKLAYLHQKQRHYDSSLVLLQRTYDIYNALDSKSGMAKIQLLKGDVYLYKNNSALALDSYVKASKLFLELSDSSGFKICVINAVKAQNNLGLFELSREMLQKHENHFSSCGVELRKLYLELFSEVYSNLNLHDKALSLYKESILLRDSVPDKKIERAFEELKWSYKTELNKFSMEQGDIHLADWENDSESIPEKKMKRLTLFVIVIGGISILIFSIVFYIQKNANTITKKKLASKTSELEEKEHQYGVATAIVEHQKRIISQQINDISESVDKLKSNLETLLPDNSHLTTVLGSHILFFQPKQEVSGDFYWVNDNDGIKTIVLGDSAGGQLSSALFSVFVLNCLNKLVATNMSDPADYLNALGVQVKKLQDEAKDSYVGLRIGVVCVDEKNKELRFSGARMNLFHFRNEKLTKIKGANKTLALGSKDYMFSSQVMNIEDFDQVFLFTKGIIDQPSGPLPQKITEKRFVNQLEVLSSYEIEEQKEELLDLIHKYKGDDEQLDDMSLLTWKIL